ncbi:MAG: ABC transporter permease [Geminicoccaceae bacterium]
MTYAGPTLLKPYWVIFHYWPLLASSINVALRTRYAGSLLGLFWIVLGPALLLSLYAVIYTVVFDFRPTVMSRSDYVLYIFAGLVPFLTFSQALTSGTASLVKDQALLMNAVFPAELIPLREVLSAAPLLFVGFGIIAGLKLLFFGGPLWTWILVPAIAVAMAMAITGFVWILSLANLVAKDVQQVLTYLIIMLLISSPIAYTPDMLTGAFRILMYANPLSYYVSSFQQVLVLGQVPPAEILIGGALISLISFHAMYAAFDRGKTLILDYV